MDEKDLSSFMVLLTLLSLLTSCATAGLEDTSPLWYEPTNLPSWWEAAIRRQAPRQAGSGWCRTIAKAHKTFIEQDEQRVASTYCNK